MTKNWKIDNLLCEQEVIREPLRTTTTNNRRRRSVGFLLHAERRKNEAIMRCVAFRAHNTRGGLITGFTRTTNRVVVEASDSVFAKTGQNHDTSVFAKTG